MPKLVIPNNEIYNRINDQILSKEVSEWLYKTYQDSPSLGELLVDTIQASWMAVNRRVLLGENHPDGITLPFNWNGYKIVDVDVIEKSIPNSLLEYMSRFGYDAYFTLPDKYKIGMVITLKFAYITDFSMLVSKKDAQAVEVSKFFVSDFVIQDTDNQVYFYRCMSKVR